MNATVLQLPFFTNLLILLVAARILGELMARFRQPAMLGEILAGILLGPSVLGIMDRTEEIKVISDLGIFLLVILAGLEINIDDILPSIKGRNILTSLTALAIPLTGGWLVGQVFGLDAFSGLLIGLCMAITALPVGIRMLQDMGRLNTPLGQRLISVAIFDDVLALSLLAIILSLQNT
ncbi:MAG: cation:proton antiporter [Bacteroidia bacterium]